VKNLYVSNKSNYKSAAYFNLFIESQCPNAVYYCICAADNCDDFIRAIGAMSSTGVLEPGQRLPLRFLNRVKNVRKSTHLTCIFVVADEMHSRDLNTPELVSELFEERLIEYRIPLVREAKKRGLKVRMIFKKSTRKVSANDG